MGKLSAALVLVWCASVGLLQAQGLPAGKPWLGVAIEQGQEGVRVEAVLPDSPAQKSGLQVNDEILQVDGVSVRSPRELIERIQSKGIGFQVSLQLRRQGRIETKAMALEAQPDTLSMLRKLYIDRPSPSFAVENLQSKQVVSVESFRGKPVLLEFWTTWCPACRASIPELHQLRSRYPELQIVAISDEERDVLLAFVRNAKIQYPVFRDPDGKASRAFQVSSIPSFFLLDRQGKVRDLALGGGRYLEELAGKIDKLVKEP